MYEDKRVMVEAAAFRGLVHHLQRRTDAQNIDIMNLAGFCRNCLAKWYKAASEHYDVPVDYDQAREIIYGMPYESWKKTYQEPATDEKQARFEETRGKHAEISVIE